LAKKNLDEILSMLNFLLEDTSLPRNIKRVIQEAKNTLLAEQDFQTKVSSTIQMLVEVSEDVNMPSHIRTYIWDILMRLESL